MRVLVTGANGDIGEAVGRLLTEIRPSATVIGADASDDEWPGASIFSAMHRTPSGASGDYLTALVDLVEQVGADLVIPTTEPELEALAQDQRGLPLLMSSAALVSRFT